MLVQRALAALVFAPALLAVIWLGGNVLAIAALVLAALMLWEFVHLTLGRGLLHLKVVAALLTAALAVATLGWLPPWLTVVALPLGIMLLLTVTLARPEPLPQATIRAGLVCLGAGYAGGLITYLSRLRELPEAGLGLAMMAVFCTWAADTGAYFCGRTLGRHKLYPVISPAKTVEGCAGALLGAVLAAFLIRWLFAVPLLGTWHVVAVGVITAVLGVVGDLCESMLKRSVGAKDSSRLIPGHGGVLDRFDAVMFVAPGLYAFASWALPL